MTSRKHREGEDQQDLNTVLATPPSEWLSLQRGPHVTDGGVGGVWSRRHSKLGWLGWLGWLGPLGFVEKLWPDLGVLGSAPAPERFARPSPFFKPQEHQRYGQ